MGDLTSDFIFSIDPGIVNIGVSCYNGKTGEVFFANKLTLAPSLKSMENDAEIIPRVYKLFFDSNSPYRKMIDNSKIVLIEKQMKLKMFLIQYTIGTFCFSNNINYEFVAPQSVKAHFNTGSRSRVEKGTVVKGKKGNHAANKKLGTAKAKELFPEYMATVSVIKQDDIADALLQALWYSQGGDKFIEKKNNTLSKKRQRKAESSKPKQTKKKKQ